MRFQVPQFIEVEDKIFGQLTLKQFIYLAGGAGLSFIIYTILDNFLLTLIPAVIIMGASASLAFIKINNKPFVSIVESAFHYYFGNKLYIWKKEEKVANKKVAEQEQKKYQHYSLKQITSTLNYY